MTVEPSRATSRCRLHACPRACRDAQAHRTGSSSSSSASSARAAMSSTSPSTSSLLHGIGLYYISAAVGSFLVAVTSNYTWNRLWTFRAQRGAVAYQGHAVPRRLDHRTRSRTSRCFSCSSRSDSVRSFAQAIAIVLVTPVNFIGNKLWSFGPRQLIARARARRSRARVPLRRPGLGGDESRGRPAVRSPGDAEFALDHPKVARVAGPLSARSDDLGIVSARRPNLGGEGLVGRSRSDRLRRRRGHDRPCPRGTYRPAGRLEDGSRPRRARSAAGRSTRGTSGSAFCVAFFVGLADLRRPLALRNLDLLVLLGFSVSLWFFNRGEIFTSVPARLSAASST